MAGFIIPQLSVSVSENVLRNPDGDPLPEHGGYGEQMFWDRHNVREAPISLPKGIAERAAAVSQIVRRQH